MFTKFFSPLLFSLLMANHSMAAEEAFGLKFGMTRDQVLELTGGKFYKNKNTSFDNTYQTLRLPNESLGKLPENAKIEERYVYFDQEGKLYRVLIYFNWFGGSYYAGTMKNNLAIYKSINANIMEMQSFQIINSEEQDPPAFKNEYSIGWLEWSSKSKKEFAAEVDWTEKLFVAILGGDRNWERDYRSKNGSKLLTVQIHGNYDSYSMRVSVEACLPEHGETDCKTRYENNKLKASAF